MPQEHPIINTPLDIRCPLTQTQKGIYAECMKREGEPVYNATILVRINAAIDAQRLADAISNALNAHVVTKVHIKAGDDGTPYMEYDESLAEDKCQVIHTTEAEFALMRQDIVKPFNLACDRLCRATVFVTETCTYYCLDIHHIIFDGISMGVFFDEIDRFYHGEPLRQELVTAFDISAREAKLRQTTALATARDWYLKEYGDLESVTLPEPDKNNGGAMSFSHQNIRLRFTPQQLQQFCQQTETSPSAFTCAAFGRLLGTYTGKHDLAFASIWHGRHDKDTLRTMSMMVKTIPVRCRYDADTTVTDYVRQLTQQSRDTRQYDIYSFAELCSETNLTADMLFAYHGPIRGSFTIDGCKFIPEIINEKETGAHIAISVVEDDNGLFVKVEYFSNLYSDDYIARLIDSFDTVMANMAANPQAKVCNISIVSDSQQKEIDAFRQVAEAELTEVTFNGGIERWAQLTPDAIALIATDRTLTYRQYNEAANRLAHALTAHGVRKGDRIVLLLPRSSHFLVALFAVMKCGAAYIPMDPAYPSDRISYILDDSDGRFVLTTASHINGYADKALDIEKLMEESLQYEPTQPDVKVDAHDLAYLIYTSGSTGKPKGVMIEHIAAANFFLVHPANHIILTATVYAKVVLCQTTVSFDLSISEYGIPLFNGKTVVFANEEETINPVAQAELCVRTGVESISGTPSRIAMNLELGTYADMVRKQIKSIMTGGEKLPLTLIERLKSMNLILVNGYGPTETTMGSSGAVMNDAAYVHIGKPSVNYTYQILDSDLNELPVGVTGELVIGGKSLARGYNKMPEKTAAAFINWNGKRVYRTGDYARWTADGNVVILGRKDNQVKLNGLRIELGEIETVMAKQHGVKQCVIVIKKVGGQDKLIAYYTLADGQHTSVDDIKTGMAEHLTHYMIPSIFMQMDSMPITPAGKIDVKHLPEPTVAAEKIVEPATELEQSLFDIIAEILDNRNFGVTTNLMSAGLTSLLTIRLSILIKKQFGTAIKVTDLMEQGTIRNICTLIPVADESQPTLNDNDSTAANAADGNRSHSNHSQNDIRNERMGDACVHLTFAQQGVYFDCLKNPGTTIYNIPTLMHFPSSVSADQLSNAVTAVLTAHPALFCKIMNLGDDPVMVCPRHIAVKVTVSEMKDTDLDSFRQKAVHPFDLQRGPLFRAEVIHTESSLLLFLDIHHLVADGASIAIIISQIVDVLNGKTVTTEDYTYFQFADSQRAFAESSNFLDTVDFYDQQMKDYTQPVAIPADFFPTESGAQKEVSLPIDSISADFLADIDSFCKAKGCTQAQFWYAVIAYVLSRYASTDDVYMCGISSGRQNLDIASTVGMFVNTLALHTHIGKQSVSDYISSAAQTFAGTMRHEDYPFAQIAANYHFRPLFNYVYQLGLINPFHVNDEAIGIESLDTKVPKFPVSVSIEHVDGKPSVMVTYDDAFYKQETMDRLADNLLTAAHEMMAHPDDAIGTITVNIPERNELNRNLDYLAPANEGLPTASSTDNAVVQQFCDIFAKILGREKVGADDNFFELGGTSLVAVRVVIEAMNAGFKLDYKTVFANPTPRLLAQQVSNASPTTTSDAPSADNASGALSSPSDSQLLAANTLDAFRSGQSQPIGGAIVTGATGYLALHIIKELIDDERKPPIYCLVRPNEVQTATSRLRALLFYYFDDSFDDLIGKRLFIIEGDITHPEVFDKFPTSADGVTHLFNCAANVKHFSSGTDIEDTNLGGARNCIDFCLRAGIIMVQTSTLSVAGTTVSDHPVPPHDITEQEIYWGQTLDNQYIRSKFEAERSVLDAIEQHGLNAKIMRLGNLAARSTDGEYQVNFSTNSFMGRLRAYQAVGYIPYEAMSTSIEFSPINEVAHAVVLLSQTPRQCTIFHPVNSNSQSYGNVVNCLKCLGINIQLAEQADFEQHLRQSASDPNKASILQSMLAYQQVADGKYVAFNGFNNHYTTQVLMRLGFQWSFTSWDYIERFLKAISGLGFFDDEYER